MANVYGAEYVSLHVRRTNRAAISLYRDSLGYEVHDVEKGYCASSFPTPLGEGISQVRELTPPLRLSQTTTGRTDWE